MNFLYWNMYDFNNDMNLWERIADTLWTLSWYNDYADERRHVLLFSILILGQNVVSYNVQNELRLVKKGFPLRYSLKEKLQCKSVIGMFLLLLPMLCYWIAYKFELFSILLWIWMPIQSIIIFTAKNRLQRLLYILPFYILSLLSMRVWQMFF